MLLCSKILFIACLLFSFAHGYFNFFFSLLSSFLLSSLCYSPFIYFNSIFFLKIGELKSEDKLVLKFFYNSLTSKGSLNWNLNDDFCKNTGVVCDNSTPDQRVTKLYFFISFFFFFFFSFSIHKTIKKSYLLYFLKIECSHFIN